MISSLKKIFTRSNNKQKILIDVPNFLEKELKLLIENGFEPGLVIVDVEDDLRVILCDNCEFDRNTIIEHEDNLESFINLKDYSNPHMQVEIDDYLAYVNSLQFACIKCLMRKEYTLADAIDMGSLEQIFELNKPERQQISDLVEEYYFRHAEI